MSLWCPSLNCQQSGTLRGTRFHFIPIHMMSVGMELISCAQEHRDKMPQHSNTSMHKCRHTAPTPNQEPRIYMHTYTCRHHEYTHARIGILIKQSLLCQALCTQHVLISLELNFKPTPQQHHVTVKVDYTLVPPIHHLKMIHKRCGYEL